MKAKDVLILGLFFIIYLFFPSVNPTTDSWYYASCVKYGSDLFSPHHLLYNAFMYGLFYLLELTFIHVEALSFMQAINAVFAILCLFLFRSLLQIIGAGISQIRGCILIAGASFVFMRFATDNETYLLALLLSLVASYFFLSDQCKHRNGILISGLLAALACLFHQIHFFWWLGFFITIIIYNKSLKALLQFSLPALIVPIAYYLVVKIQNDQSGTDAFIQFIFYEYFQGVSTSFSFEYLKLGAINFIRSFVQLHGHIFLIVRSNWLFALPAVLTLLFLFFGLSRKQIIKKKQTLNREHRFLFIILFILQLAFAVYSFGNAEFMVMIPFLLLLIMRSMFQLNWKSLYWIGAAMLIWNFSYAILPSNKMQLNADDFLAAEMKKNKTDLFIIQNSQRLENKMYYQLGIIPGNMLRSPFSYNERGKSLTDLQNIIEQSLENGIHVFTDCLNARAIDRSFMLSAKQNMAFFSNYKISKFDSTQVLNNSYFLFQISK